MARSPQILLLAGAILALLPLDAGAQGQAPTLPAGAGKEAVEGACSGCHQLNLIPQSSGYTQDGWKALIATMIDLTPSAQSHAEIVQYLATNFPPNTKRAPKLVSGPVEVTFKEWA